MTRSRPHQVWSSPHAGGRSTAGRSRCQSPELQDRHPTRAPPQRQLPPRSSSVVPPPGATTMSHDLQGAGVNETGPTDSRPDTEVSGPLPRAVRVRSDQLRGNSDTVAIHGTSAVDSRLAGSLSCTARHRCQPSEKTRPATSGAFSIRRALRDKGIWRRLCRSAGGSCGRNAPGLGIIDLASLSSPASPNLTRHIRISIRN